MHNMNAYRAWRDQIARHYGGLLGFKDAPTVDIWIEKIEAYLGNMNKTLDAMSTPQHKDVRRAFYREFRDDIRLANVELEMLQAWRRLHKRDRYYTDKQEESA